MERFLDPKTLARVKDMPLVARTVADGFLHGIHQSHQRGVGVEFSQYRSYEPGDDPGRIDWKLFARSDRYFVREAERESEVAIWFVIDASQSMAQKTETGAWSKFDYARHLLAALAWITQRQGDLAGLLALSSAQQTFVPLAAGERHWHAILRRLHKLQPGDRFPDTQLVRSHLARLQKPGLVFVLSDFYQHNDEILGFMRQICGSRTEVVALQMQSNDELEFPWKGPVRFEDLESGEQVLVSARGARESYLQALEAHQDSLRQALARLDVALHSVNIDQPMDKVLHTFLSRRNKRLD